jgi:hypothetical protein
MKDLPPRKLYPGENAENKFKVAYIAGTGTNAQYWRLANSIVRNSGIYKSLCLKIYKLKGLVGIKQAVINRLKKANKELTQTFRQYERDADKEFKKQAKAHESTKKQLATARANVKRDARRHMSALTDNKKITARNRKLRQQVSTNKQFENFTTKEFEWSIKGNSESDQYRAELMLRAIFGYEELKNIGEITYTEICYLAVASQIDAFNKKQIHNRFGTTLSKYFLREIGKMIEKGWVRKFDRREFYYITDDGRKQFRKVISLIYSKKYGHYWKRIFQDEEKEEALKKAKEIKTLENL